MEVLVNNRFHCLTRVRDNFFVGMRLGRFQTPLRVRLTSVSGEQVEALIPDIKDDVSFPASVQFAGINGGGKFKVAESRECGGSVGTFADLRP